MLKINRRTDYAVRVILALAKRPFGGRLSTQVIQEEMQIPRPFLQRIIADLSKVGLLETFPGPSGGLQLARPAAEINLRHIWEAIEGPLEISACLNAPDDCPFGFTCPVRCRWGRLQNLMLRELESTTFSELAEEAAAQPGNFIRLQNLIPASSA
jgi:Rrf2 family transcriptional regulator, nitric oxide-sensitive transcriptional repressor